MPTHGAPHCLFLWRTGTVLTKSDGRSQLAWLTEDDFVGGASAALDLLLSLTKHTDDSIADAAARGVAHACMPPYSLASSFLAMPAAMAQLVDLLSHPATCKRHKAAVHAIFHILKSEQGTPPVGVTSEVGHRGDGTRVGEDGFDSTTHLAKLACCVRPLMQTMEREDCPPLTRMQIADIVTQLAQTRCELNGNPTGFAMLLIRVRRVCACECE